MKRRNIRQKGFAHLFLLVVVVIIGIGAIGYLAYQNGKIVIDTETSEVSTPPTTALKKISPTPSTENGNNECYENEKYFIVVNPENRKFLVKYKTSENANYDCIYQKGSLDYEISDQEWCGPCYQYLGLENNYLVLDYGTGPPPRGYEIIDLEKRLKIHDGSYNAPFEVKPEYFQYWKTTSKEVTDENCPNKDEWDEYGLGSAIEELVRLDYSNMQEASLNEFRCSPRQ